MIIRILAVIAAISALAAFPAALLLRRLTPWSSFPAWFAVFVLLAGGLLSLAVFERRAPLFGPIFWKGKPGANRVALTFDDGPNEPFTSEVIDILKRKGVAATYFVVGRNCLRHPGAVQRLAEEGFEIGNHTWDHEVLPLKSPGAIRAEITKTSDLVERLTGRRPALFRAPHGWRNPWVSRAAGDCGCVPVAWSLGVWDTDRPGAAKIVERTLAGVFDGCVLLLHDGRGTEETADSGQLVEAISPIIDELKRRGFRFVTVTEMMGGPAR